MREPPADQDGVGITGSPPRQVAPMRRIPGQHSALKGSATSAGDHRSTQRELDGDRDFLGEVAGRAMVGRLLFEWWLRIGAGGRHLGDRAAGVETATGGGGYGGRGLRAGR